eukprot:jgi/Hompol1/4121/HPOL_003474-RA
MSLKEFASFSPDERLKLCGVMEFEQHPPNKLLVMEGHQSNCYYIIMSGRVRAFRVIEEGGKQMSNVIGRGEAIGSLAMAFADAPTKRSASFVSVDTCKLLRINLSDIKRIALSTKQQLETKVSRVESILSFEKEIVLKLMPYIQFKSFEPQQTLAFQNGVSLQIFWILSGTCRCVKSISYIRDSNGHKRGVQRLHAAQNGSTVGEHDADSKKELRSDLVKSDLNAAVEETGEIRLVVPQTNATEYEYVTADEDHAQLTKSLKPDESIQTQLFHVCDLKPGDHYPPLPYFPGKPLTKPPQADTPSDANPPITRSMPTSQTHAIPSFDKNAYTQFLRERNAITCGVSVVATKHVDIVTMLWVEFIQSVPAQLVQRIMQDDQHKLVNLPIGKLRKIFLEKFDDQRQPSSNAVQ